MTDPASAGSPPSGSLGRPWRAADALAFVDDVASPVLDDADAHHLRRVLRLRPGDPVCVSDGHSAARACTLGADGVLTVAGDPVALEVVSPEIMTTVGVVPPKGDRLDLLVAKLTELGVDRIVLLDSERAVVRWDEARAGRALGRLDRIARSSCAQSRRPRLPEIELGDLGSLLSSGAPIADLEGRPISVDDRILLIGPEGGWSDAERAAADAPGAGGRVQLAGGVLRVETAAIAAAAVMAALAV